MKTSVIFLWALLLGVITTYVSLVSGFESVQLPDLPYSYDALEPHIDEITMILHHQGHHMHYVNELNEALINLTQLVFTSPVLNRVLECTNSTTDLLRNLQDVPEELRERVRNNGGGHINHYLFWRLMAPTQSIYTEYNQESRLAQAIEDKWGFEQFREAFTETAVNVFGSGWAWLTVDTKGELQIRKFDKQDTPAMLGEDPVLGIDMWEHAYYLRYQNDTELYVENWWNVVNWEYADMLYSSSRNLRYPHYHEEIVLSPHPQSIYHTYSQMMEEEDEEEQVGDEYEEQEEAGTEGDM